MIDSPSNYNYAFYIENCEGITIQYNNIYELSDKIPMEVMEDIFEIQELLQKNELSSDEISELELYLKQFKKIQKKSIEEIEQFFNKEKRNTPSQNDKNLLNNILNKSAYLKRIRSQIEDKLDEL